MELYTVDRSGTLVEGVVCPLSRYSDIAPRILAEHVEDLFPAGLSMHGEKYFLQNNAQALAAEPMLELLFENVRRSAYPERPSRLQSMFGFESLAEAIRGQSRLGGGAIFKVHSEVVFRADMNLLHAGNSTLITSWFAHQYWAGECGPETPFWELVMKCPVSVGERVK